MLQRRLFAIYNHLKSTVAPANMSLPEVCCKLPPASSSYTPKGKTSSKAGIETYVLYLALRRLYCTLTAILVQEIGSGDNVVRLLHELV